MEIKEYVAWKPKGKQGEGRNEWGEMWKGRRKQKGRWGKEERRKEGRREGREDYTPVEDGI